jgi:hypothetical protein
MKSQTEDVSRSAAVRRDDGHDASSQSEAQAQEHRERRTAKGADATPETLTVGFL